MARRYKIKCNIKELCLLLTLMILLSKALQLMTRKFYNIPDVRKPNLKYILLWTNPQTESSLVFRAMGEGTNVFLLYHCPVSNCYVTTDKTFTREITDYHVILFHGPDLNLHDVTLPETRHSNQKYVFQSLESSAYYPILDKKYDNFFNLTWTYKLNSDIHLGYILIKNKNGDVIGPRERMTWLEVKDMKPIDEKLQNELNQKTKLAAWFMSNQWTVNKRLDYVDAMQYELDKFNRRNLTIDIYGTSAVSNKCPINEMNRCKRMLKKDYYFYLSFENSNCEDYVTEKLLTALQNNVVPVVFGGANYTRFMPDGAYLNARLFRPRELVRQMIDIVTNRSKYYEFFKWTNYYSYHDAYENPETNAYCKFCRKMNEKTSNVNHYKKFRNWWNCPVPKDGQRKRCKNNCV